MAEGYSELANETAGAANGIGYAYRDTGAGSAGGVPLVLLQHFRGNLDNWDPALIDALAATRRVVTFDNAGVGGSTGTTPDTIGQMARDAIAFLAAMDFGQVDLLGFSIGSFVAQEIALTGRPSSAGWCWPPRRRRARPACTAGRPRSSARSARRRPAPRTTSACSSPLGSSRAGRPGGAAAHVRPDRGPRRGDDLGDPRGAVRRGLHLGHPGPRAARSGSAACRCRCSWPTATATR